MPRAALKSRFTDDQRSNITNRRRGVGGHGGGGWGQIRKKIPAQLLQKKYKSCIMAQSKKKNIAN